MRGKVRVFTHERARSRVTSDTNYRAKTSVDPFPNASDIQICPGLRLELFAYKYEDYNSRPMTIEGTEEVKNHARG